MTSASEANPQTSKLTFWHEGAECCDVEWEAAYERFETPDEEVTKFSRRFRRLGVDRNACDLDIVDLFCGRGSGLLALERMGFQRLEGVDLSPSLLKRYRGSAKLFVGDCRSLRFESETKDVVIVQGGLHHLSDLPDDLDAVLSEARRVLKPGGYFVMVEPWLTPFLRIVHGACRVGLFRRYWPKLDALACMIDREKETYFQWLSKPRVVESLLIQYFECERRLTSFGKLMFVGRKA